MKRGVLGVPEPDSIGAADGITGVESEVETHTDENSGKELTRAINVKEQKVLSGDTDYYVGEAFRERFVEDDEFYVEDSGKIRNRTTRDKVVQDHTNFLLVPADGSHNGYMLVDSSSGVFAYGMVSRQNVGRLVPADLQLGSFYLEREDTFSAQTSGGPTVGGKMTAWGSDVLDDEEIGRLLRSAARSDQLNQLAGNYVYEKPDGSGYPYEVNMASSGYVEVWNPNDLTTSEFLEWVEREVLPYATIVEDDEDEQSELPTGDDEEDA